MLPDPHGKLAGVDPPLVKVVLRAAQITTQPFQVVQGLRTAAEQARLYAQGRTTPGAIVTWVKVSNHQAKADGYGHAVDLAAIKPDGSIDWSNHSAYAAIDDAMNAAAKEQGVRLRYGGNWNMNNVRFEGGETDVDHWELYP